MQGSMLPPTDFPGIALITGAGGQEGIGSAVAHAFLRAGCTKLIITDLSPSSLSETFRSLQTEHNAIQPTTYLTILPIIGDISSPAFVTELFDTIRAKFGRLDYAVNCAGVIGNNKATSESTLDEFDAVHGVNYRGLWMCVRGELEIMRRQQVREREGYEGARRQRGAIVNIASQLGVVGRPDAPLYCASKSAVIGLTRCDAIDNSKYLIRINAVCPGVIDTPMTNQAKRDPSHPQYQPPSPLISPGRQHDETMGSGGVGGSRKMDLTESVNIAPMKRMGLPEEVADCVLFLCSERASFVQGAAWVIDGGYTIV